MLTLSTLLLVLSLSIGRAANTLDIELSQARINYSPVDYTFTLRADVYTEIASGSTVELKFPSDYSSIFPASPDCYDGTGRSLPCSGVTSTRKVTVSNYFSSTITDRTFIIIIKSLTNPSHTSSTGSFTMSIISPSQATLLTAGSTVSITEGTAACSITTDSNVIGATTKIKFNITPSNLISANGGLEITFPKWSSQGESMVSSPNSIICNLTSPTTRTPGSCYMATSDQLSVGTIMTTAIQPGTLITLEFNSITNPPLTDPYTFTVRTLDSNGLGVDKCTPTLKVTSPNKIVVNQNNFLTCITNSNKKQINTIETCILTFKTTNPLPKGATIDIVFPTEVGITSSFRVNEDSPVSISSLSITSAYPTIKLLNAVSVYTAGSTEFDIRFISIQHPATTQPTSSFQITTSVNGNPIDTITSGVTYTASPGDLSAVQITASPSEAGSTANVNFKFNVKNAVTTASQIKITFPNEFSNGTISCTGSGSKIVSSPTCSWASNVLTVSNYATSSITSSDPVSITVKNMILPQSSKPTTAAFDIFTQENGYKVDRNNAITFTADPAIITSNVALSITTGAEVGGDSAYNITFQNRNPIPAAGKFQVTMPNDNSVTIVNTKVLGTDTKAEIRGSLNTFPTTVNSTAGTLLFTNPTLAEIPIGSTIKIIIPSLRNPPDTGATSSFTVQTLTSDGYTIDSVLTGLSIPDSFISPSDFYLAEIDAMPSGTGATSAYNITFEPKVLLSSTDILTITFPSNYTFKSTVTCTIAQPQQKAAVNCYPGSSKTITISLGQDIQAQQSFEVDISGVVNPKIAGSYSGFSLATKDTDGAKIHQTLSGLSVTVDPSVITDITMDRGTNKLGQTTLFTLTFVPKNQYPTDAYIEVVVPSQLTIRTSPALVCNAIQGLGQDPTCTIKTGTTRTIVMTGAGSYSSSKIKFSLDSLVNQATMIDSDSFRLIVKDVSGGIIDQVTTGLEALAPCSSNCATCLTDNRNYCTSCSTGKLLDIVSNNCVDTCVSRTYQDGTQCKGCHSSCLYCEGPASTQCTACDTTSSLPSLYQKQCVKACPSKYYSDSNGVCQTCTSPCDTCSSATTCKTCVSGTFLLNGQCGNTCPQGYYKDTSAWKCHACKSNCLTCSSGSSCLSCDTSSNYPIFFGNDCLSKCPDGYYSSNNTCLQCKSPCTTCSSSADFCLSCTPGLYADNGVCKTCSSPCKTCVGDSTKCTSCLSDSLVVQNNVCVAGCSSGYYLDTASKTCLTCAANCKTCNSLQQCTLCDASSSTPYLYAGSCTEKCPNDTLLTASRECIDKSSFLVNPYTGIYTSGLPFPFVIFGLIFSVLSFVGRMVSDTTLVISNIIGFFSLLEFASWIAFMALLSLSHPDDSVSEYPGLPLTIVGFIIAIGLNVFFYIRIIRPMMKEGSIANWMKEKKSRQVVGYIGQGLTILSFKSFRLVYSRFFGLDALSVQIPKPKTFASNLNKFTGVNFFFSVLFVLIGAIVTLNKDSDLPQLLHISIEILLISLITTILTIYDALRTTEAEIKPNVGADESNYLAAQSRVLSMLGRSIMDKLNESMETGGKDMKRFGGMNRSYKRRNSLNLDSSNEFNESELHGLDAGSFMRVNSSFNDKRLGQSIDYKRNDESFNEHDRSRIQAIKENQEEEDEEPGVYSRNTIFAGSRNELNPDRIVIENKDGSITQLGSKRANQSPTKAQMKSSRREERNSAVVYEQVSSRSKIDEEAGRVNLFALKERSANKANKGLKSGTKKGKKDSDSEDELELHDSYGNVDANLRVGHARVIRDYMQEANMFPIQGNEENTVSARGERKTAKDQERYDKSGKKEQQTLESHRLSNAYTSPIKTIRGQPSQRTAEKGRRGVDENERTMEVEEYDAGNKTSAKKDNFNLSGRKTTGFSAKKGTPFKSPYKMGNYTGGDFGVSPLKSGTKTQEQPRTPERKPGSQLDYVSSGSQSPGEDREDYFQDDTPNNYNALNQRFEEELAPSSNLASRVFEPIKIEVTVKPQKDSPEKPTIMPTIMQNFTGEKEEKEEKRVRSVEHVDRNRDYPLKAHSRGEVDRPETTNYNTRLSLGERGSGMKRAGTPQTYTPEVKRAMEYRAGPIPRRTLESFVKDKKKEEKKEEEKDPELHFGRITEKDKQEKLERLENIYSSQKKPKRKLRSSTESKNQVKGSHNSIEDNMAEQGVDNHDLEISNFGRFEDFVNEMKIHGESDENVDQQESFRPEDM